MVIFDMSTGTEPARLFVGSVVINNLVSKWVCNGSS